MEISEYLDENEIEKLIKAAPTLQKKTFFACLFESGSRPEEFLRWFAGLEFPFPISNSL